jgi:hypothetical protein
LETNIFFEIWLILPQKSSVCVEIIFPWKKANIGQKRIPCGALDFFMDEVTWASNLFLANLPGKIK